MGWFSRRKESTQQAPKPYWIQKVRRDVLELAFANAKAHHPQEFGGMLRARKGVIEEILILPGTIVGDTHAIFQMHMLPIDFSVKGTIHSHPTPNATPSGADRDLFARYGTTHIIVGAPYRDGTWRAYNARGEPIHLEVLD